MATPEGCPCDAVRELKEIVTRHDAAINDSALNRALINQKLDTLIESSKNKKDFWKGALVALISVALTLIGNLLIK